MITREQFYKIANVKQHSQFQKYLEDIITNKDERLRFYRECVKTDPQCVEDDTFRQYFEDYAAERKSNKQDFTPHGISKLVNELTKTNVNETCGWTAYDAAAGTGTLIIDRWKKERDKFMPWDFIPSNYLYMAQELSDSTIPYLVHNLAIRGMNAIVIHGDTLEGAANQIYFIQNTKNDCLAFSSINVLPHTDEIAEFFKIKEWNEDAIDHIEDSLEDVRWMIPDKLWEEIEVNEK